MDFQNNSLKPVMDFHLTDKFVKTYLDQPSLRSRRNQITYTNLDNKDSAYKRLETLLKNNKLEKLLRSQGVETYKDFVTRKVKLLNSYYNRREELNKLFQSRSVNGFKKKQRLFNNILLNFNVDNQNQNISEEINTFSNFLLSNKKERLLNHKSIFKEQQNTTKKNVSTKLEKLPALINEPKEKLNFEFEPLSFNVNYRDVNEPKEKLNFEFEPVSFNVNYRDVMTRCADGYEALGLLIAAKLRLIDKKNEVQKILCENLINNVLVGGMLGRLTKESHVVI